MISKTRYKETEYEYDALNRLTKEAKYREDKWSHHKHLIYSYEYTFDAVDNRLTMRRNLHQPMFWGCYNNDDLMDDMKNDFCRNGFDRDEAERSGVPMNIGNGTTSEYRYDGVGKRIQSIDGGIVTKYLYDGLNVIIERDASGNTLVYYTRGLSYGGGIGGIISRIAHPESRILYYHYDGIGSVTGLTGLTGETIQTYTYDAYGNILSSSGVETNPYQFSTKEYSAKSGLAYFGARFYDAKIGRWISKDPYTYAPDDQRIYAGLSIVFIGQVNRMLQQNGGILEPSHYINLHNLFKTSWRDLTLQLGSIDPKLLHRYTYCYNNSVNYIDSWGLRGKNWAIIGSDAVATGGSLVSQFLKPIKWVKWTGKGISFVASRVSMVLTFDEAAKGEGRTADALVAVQTVRVSTIAMELVPWVDVGVSLTQIVYDFIAQDP